VHSTSAVLQRRRGPPFVVGGVVCHRASVPSNCTPRVSVQSEHAPAQPLTQQVLLAMEVVAP
jgi:hypothetical protein